MISEDKLAYLQKHVDACEVDNYLTIGTLLTEIRALRKVVEASKFLRRYCRECAGQENQYYLAEREFDYEIAAYEGGDSK